jgi:glycine C-acetyltransferase/8-amino-7-oxononanoate synthase
VNRQQVPPISPPLQQVDRTYVRYGKAKLSYFGGCDYFRLSSHPSVLRAIEEGLRAQGLTVAASRVTTGNHRLYELLEARLAKFFDAPSAVLLSSGYLSNLAVAQALAGTFSHALMDERAHASLVDAAPFLDCPIIRFRHRDAGDVAKALQRIGPVTRPILLTDGLFSHDGSVAPVQEYLRTLPRDGMILLDDAHGAGLLGNTGKGTIEQQGVSRNRVIQTVALSKAFGVYGGAVLGSPKLGQQIQTKSRLFSGNTPLPLPLANGALRAIEILSSAKNLRVRLMKNIERTARALHKMGYPSANAASPIFPLVPRHPEDVPQLKRRCVAEGVFPSFIKYPGGPADGYFRFTISSEHTPAQIEKLVRVFAP